MAMITVVEYAQRIGKDHRVVRQKIKRGKLEAVKCGGTWLIEEDTPYIDCRRKKENQQ